MNQLGKLKLIIGPMFSGKSTELIHTVKRYKYKNKKTILVKFDLDNRYSSEDKVVTHDLQEHPAIRCQNLRDIFDSLAACDVIGVDEGQFYGDLVEICMELILLGRTVIVSALSSTYKMEPFENISFLISKADKIKFKKSICHICQDNTAPFTLRTIPNNDLLLVGAADCYKSVCRACYLKNHVFQ